MRDGRQEIRDVVSDDKEGPLTFYMLGISDIFLSHYPTKSHYFFIPTVFDFTSLIWRRVKANHDAGAQLCCTVHTSTTVLQGLKKVFKTPRPKSGSGSRSKCIKISIIPQKI